MEKEKKEINNKKNNSLIIIAAVIILLLIIFCVWFFLLRGNGGKSSNENSNADNNNVNNTVDNEPVEVVDDAEYEYDPGILYEVSNELNNSNFIIKGLILVGDKRSDFKYMDELEEKGFHTKELYSTYKFEERINIYVDTEYKGAESDVRIFITPHHTVQEYKKMTPVDLERLVDNQGGYYFAYNNPDERNHNFVGNGYIENGKPAGLYDILFLYKGKLSYYVVIEVK